MLCQNQYHESDEASCSEADIQMLRQPHRNGMHATRAFSMLQSMRKNNQLCDVIVKVGDLELACHKTVLSACSPYFFAMFTNELCEAYASVINLQEVDCTAISMLIDFMYTSEIVINEETVQTLLPTANLLQLDEVRNACCEFLQTQLHPSNCLGIRQFADVHSCRELLSSALGYVEQHFSDVVQGDEFLCLPLEHVCTLLSSDRLTVLSEEEVFEAALCWINHDRESRESMIGEVMSHVRFPLLTRDYLVDRVHQDALVKSSPLCKDLLLEAYKFHLSRDETRSNIRSVRMRPRTPLGLPKVIYIVGGQAPKAIRSVECYEFSEDKWETRMELPSRRCRAGVVVLNGLIFACGGFNGSLRVRTVEIYDPSKDCWQPATSMEARRSTLGAAVLNGMIYVVGGFDGTTGLNSAECFDPKTREWRMIASMTYRRSSVGVGVFNGRLYAVGGYDGSARQCLSSVECYDPESDSWKSVAEMLTRRSGAGVGVLDGKLYAVGGHDGPLVRDTVEAYNPEINQWSQVADMCLARRNAGVATVNGLLYVLGGDDGNCNLSSVECYNPKTDSWTMLSSEMKIGRSYAGIAVLDKVVN